VKGLIAAGGSATRLEELTRVTNKHLLPVGRWPMVYYPLQLLQQVGVHEVLLVTGQHHAGQFIDLLGNGRVQARGSGDVLFDFDLTYKVQTGRDRTGRRDGARLRRRRPACRLPRRQHLRARARRCDSCLG
jgi:dTDP-glucose pyrophosphorylase